VNAYLQRWVVDWLAAEDGRTAAGLARKLGVTDAQIITLKKHGRGAGPETIRAIAGLAGVTAEEIERRALDAWDASAPAPRELVVERPARYPNLAAALAFLGDEVLPETHRVMAGVKLKSNDDLPRAEWVDEILNTDRQLRRRAKMLPAEVDAEDARKERQTDAAVERIRPPALDDED
jgi:hypothetical protein